jgi:ABC-type transporter MlaC component
MLFTILAVMGMSVLAQDVDPSKLKILRKVVMDGDTFLVYSFDEFVLKEFQTDAERLAYLKLVRNIKVVMPYAKLAAFRLQMMEDNLNQIKSKKERKKYTKEMETAIKEEFMETLKKFNVSQGKLLLKLIHRETGKSTFEILKKYRGSATTFYWGTLAKFYNASIKVEFDPIEDYHIEYIIKNLNLE